MTDTPDQLAIIPRAYRIEERSMADTDSVPRTEAGRELDNAGGWYDECGTYVRCKDLTAAILAIEVEARAGAAPLDMEVLAAALRDVLAEFDYWVSKPRPAVGGGTVRIHRFREVQPSMERILTNAARLIEGTDR